LRATLQTARAYASELRAAEALASGTPEILQPLQTLEARAERGIPTTAVLAERLDQVARDVTATDATASAGGRWSQRALAKVEGLVRGRGVGEGEGGAPGDDPVGAARAALRKGQLAPAVETMKRLPGAAAGIAAPWIADAEARLAADASLAAVDAALTQRVLS